MDSGKPELMPLVRSKRNACLCRDRIACILSLRTIHGSAVAEVSPRSTESA